MISAPGALAQNSTADIPSAGPLTDIFISRDSRIHRAYVMSTRNGNPQFAFFRPDSTTGCELRTGGVDRGQSWAFGLQRLGLLCPIRSHRSAPRSVQGYTTAQRRTPAAVAPPTLVETGFPTCRHEFYETD